jgi:hypothetical protein
MFILANYWLLAVVIRFMFRSCDVEWCVSESRVWSEVCFAYSLSLSLYVTGRLGNLPSYPCDQQIMKKKRSVDIHYGPRLKKKQNALGSLISSWAPFLVEVRIEPVPFSMGWAFFNRSLKNISQQISIISMETDLVAQVPECLSWSRRGSNSVFFGL